MQCTPSLLAIIGTHMRLAQRVLELIETSHHVGMNTATTALTNYGALLDWHGRLITSLCRDVTGATAAWTNETFGDKRKNLPQALMSYYDRLQTKKAKKQIRSVVEAVVNGKGDET